MWELELLFVTNEKVESRGGHGGRREFEERGDRSGAVCFDLGLRMVAVDEAGATSSVEKETGGTVVGRGGIELSESRWAFEERGDRRRFGLDFRIVLLKRLVLLLWKGALG